MQHRPGFSLRFNPGYKRGATSFGGVSTMHAPMPGNLLPGVPLIDSPFFDRIFPLSNPDAQTRRIAEDLRDEGFAVFDFPDPEIDRLCEEIKTRHAPGP